MSNNLVELEHYFFPEISVIANPEWRPEQGDKARPHLDIHSDCSEVEGKADTYAVQLKISIESTEENPSQYNIELMAYGILVAHENLHDKKKNMLVTGASILYSASRELLLGVMSRGPWPPIMLHAMPFNISRPEQTPKKARTPKAPKKMVETKEE